jgi:hypothetical protein|tara:strand:+ start:8064 stop:8384 length:321 start_codon:yes stop_codon:yes gene_type:complete
MSDKLEAFEKYHNTNPHVYDLFVRFAFEILDAGHTHYSARAIIDRIRWHTNIETQGDIFKISNNQTPYYARMFSYDYPHHADFLRQYALQCGEEKVHQWLEENHHA